MRMCTTVIFTDKLAEVRAFYQKYFAQLPSHDSNANTFSITPFSESQITWVDAASVNAPTTLNATIRLTTPYTLIEHAEAVARGVPCSALTVEDWGSFYGQQVQYFAVTDPSGTSILYYEDHFGEARQLMTTGNGTGTRETQKRET